MATKKIIFVVDYNKDYLLNFIEQACIKCDAHFLFFGYRDEIINSRVHTLGIVHFWKDFKDAKQLIREIKPDKIVFFELETLNQIALNAISKELGLPTQFCDHGFQDFETSMNANSFAEHRIVERYLNVLKKLRLRGIFGVAKNRFFFNNSVESSRAKECKEFLRMYKDLRLSNSILDTRKMVFSSFANPDSLICFCHSNKNFYDQYFNDNSIPTTFTGFPEFDAMVGALPKEPVNERKILFIDQPYVNNKLYGWNRINKSRFIKTLEDNCFRHGYELLIKPHPREVNFWREIGFGNLIEDKNFLDSISDIRYVLGYNSTLLIPFAVNEFVDVLILNNHPSGHLVSDYLVKYDAASWYDPGFLDILNICPKKTDQLAKDFLFNEGINASDRLTEVLLK